MTEPSRGPATDVDNRPVPDPTVLTTEALLRAVSAERDYVDLKISVLRERLDAADRADLLLAQTVANAPNAAEKEVQHLRELMEERFSSIAIQFMERDTRSERESRDSKIALDAALQAQKESANESKQTFATQVEKSERATNEAINKLQALTATQDQALSDKIDDAKERSAQLEKSLNEKITSGFAELNRRFDTQLGGG